MKVNLFRFLAVLLIALASGVLALSVPVSVHAEPPATAVEAAPQQPALPLLSDIQAITAGGRIRSGSTCVLTTGGGVKCWGDNYYGQLGDGTTIRGWVPRDVVGLSSGVQAIAAGGDHICAVTAGGGVKCWGNNLYSQLGDGTTADSFTPVDVVGLSSGVQAIAAGYSHTCALTAGGGVKCWGRNLEGQLGDGTAEHRWTPVDVVGLSSGVQAIAAGWAHTCALMAGGTVKCWGANGSGQLGDGTTDNRLTPVDVVGLSSGVQAVAAGVVHTCAVMAGGRAKCWGWNLEGQLGDGTAEHRRTPVDVVGLSSGVQAIAAGGSHTCALMVSGGVKCWGENGDLLLLGDGTDTSHPTPVDVVGLSSGVQAIAAGNSHTCAVTAGGGVKCWGLGTYQYYGWQVLVDVSGLSSGVQAIAAGWGHTCAISAGARAKCWGHNGSGQLGDGTTDSRPTPVDVVGLSSGVQAITAGSFHTCALTAGDGVKCWGQNYYGQLGDGTTQFRLTPVDVVGLSSGVQAIAAGGGHTCALTTGGGVKCWGGNVFGQLGDGTTQFRLTPVDVVGLSSGVQAITAGGLWHTCAITAGGGVKCWGANDRGQLGDGTDTERSTPVDVVGLSSDVQAIAAGDEHTCAVMASGGVKCWGDNFIGQLGNGTTYDDYMHGVTEVTGLIDGVQAIAAGGSHTCALTAGGGVKCWGWNGYGQLGSDRGWKPEDVVTALPIIGTIVDIDLAPIANAVVTYTDSTEQFATRYTDARGTFSILAAGDYTVTVQKPTYTFFPDFIYCSTPPNECEFQFFGAQLPDTILRYFLPSVKSRVSGGDNR